MKEEECVLTEDGLDAVIKLHENTSGIEIPRAGCRASGEQMHFIRLRLIRSESRWYLTLRLFLSFRLDGYDYGYRNCYENKELSG